MQMNQHQLQSLDEGEEEEEAVHLDQISNAEMEAKIRAMKQQIRAYQFGGPDSESAEIDNEVNKIVAYNSNGHMSQNLNDLNINDVETSSVEIRMPKRHSSHDSDHEDGEHCDDEEEDNNYMQSRKNANEEFVREDLIRKIENTKRKIEREQAKAFE